MEQMSNEQTHLTWFAFQCNIFHLISPDSENGRLIYKTLKDVMIPVLRDMRTKAMEELELT